jgi:hypothetical protein
MDFVDGHERLTSIFGRWPSFHDAEVLALGYERQRDGAVGVLLSVLVRPEPGTEPSYGGLAARAFLRFHDCESLAIEADEFDHRNPLRDLDITYDAGFLPGRPVSVVIETAHRLGGLGGSFACRRAEVVDVAPADDDRQSGELRHEWAQG